MTGTRRCCRVGRAPRALPPGVPRRLAARCCPCLGVPSRPCCLCLQTEHEANEVKQLLGALQECVASRSMRLPPVAAGALLLLLRLWQGMPPYAARAAAALLGGGTCGADIVVQDYLHQVGGAPRQPC